MFLLAKQGELEAAVDSFERALDFAKLQEDRDAEKAIKKALKDVNERIAKKLSDPGSWFYIQLAQYPTYYIYRINSCVTKMR